MPRQEHPANPQEASGLDTKTPMLTSHGGLTPFSAWAEARRGLEERGLPNGPEQSTTQSGQKWALEEGHCKPAQHSG